MEKIIITGYFHPHKGNLSDKHRDQYKDLLNECTILAVEWPGARRENLIMLRAISSGAKPPEIFWNQGGGVFEDDFASNQFDRIQLLYHTGKTVFCPDIPQNSDEYNMSEETSRKLYEVHDVFYNSVLEGQIHSQGEFLDILNSYKEAEKEDSQYMETRERYIANTLHRQIASWRKKHSKNPLHVLMPYGTYHIVGLARMLKNDPNIDYHSVLQVPVLGYNDGVSLSYRAGREPSDTLAARALFEHLTSKVIEDFTIPGKKDSEETAKLMLFTKRIASAFSLEQIINLCIEVSKLDQGEKSKLYQEIELLEAIFHRFDRKNVQEGNVVLSRTLEGFNDIAVAIQDRIAYFKSTYPNPGQRDREYTLYDARRALGL